MDNNEINQCMMLVGDKIPPACVPTLRKMLERSDTHVQDFSLATMNLKNPTVSLLLSALAGAWGVDRFYIGDIGMGVLKLLSCGGLYVWWIVDIFLISDATRQYNWRQIMISFGGEGCL